MTLGEFIIKNKKHFEYSYEELSRLINSICSAAKVVNNQLNKAGLVDIIGKTNHKNLHGEVQQKLDLYANKVFIQTLTNDEIVCGIATEEEDNFITIQSKDGSISSKYVIMIDPLDGSSNIDVNVSVGTIFSVYKRVTELGTRVTIEDFLQPGHKQVAAGYVVYGTSTMIIYTTGFGVNGFTLNISTGIFHLSHPDIKTPKMGCIYSINQGYYKYFSKGVKDYLNYCQTHNSEQGTPYSGRYIGSLVSDFHRNMIKGGIYIYPSNSKSPKGKLRLLYECNPISFLAEQAGGKASDGYRRILDIKPDELHQRVPFFCGSFNMVDKAESFMKKNFNSNISYH